MSNTVKSLEFTFDTTFPELCEHISFEKISENEFFVKKGDNGIIEVNKYVFLFIQLATGQNSIVDICRKMEISVSNDNLNRICDLYFKNLAKYGIIKNKHNRTEKKEKFDRSKPHANIITIHHVDHGDDAIVRAFRSLAKEEQDAAQKISSDRNRK